jgi:hypothetical protein
MGPEFRLVASVGVGSIRALEVEHNVVHRATATAGEGTGVVVEGNLNRAKIYVVQVMMKKVGNRVFVMHSIVKIKVVLYCIILRMRISFRLFLNRYYRRQQLHFQRFRYHPIYIICQRLNAGFSRHFHHSDVRPQQHWAVVTVTL